MNKFAEKYAVGAIAHSKELIDLVIEARKEKKAIRLWRVEQMGHISPFYLTSRSRYISNSRRDDGSFLSVLRPAYNRVTGYVDHASIGYRGTRRRWFRTEILIGSYDIDGSSSYEPEHRIFTSKIAADRYSARCKGSRIRRRRKTPLGAV